MQDDPKPNELEDLDQADGSPADAESTNEDLPGDSLSSDELNADSGSDDGGSEDGFDDLDIDELERESEAIEKPKEYVAYGDRSTLNDIEKKSNYSTATGGESKILLILALIAAVIPVCFLLSWLLGLGGEAGE